MYRRTSNQLDRKTTFLYDVVTKQKVITRYSLDQNLSTAEAEFKEFESRLKYGWFHLKMYSMFQDLSRRSIETGFWRILVAAQILFIINYIRTRNNRWLVCNIWTICLELNWLFNVYDPSWMLQFSELIGTLRSSAWVVLTIVSL